MISSKCWIETQLLEGFILTTGEQSSSYLRAMGIDASTAVSGYGQEASVSGSYLDKAEVRES